MNQRDFLKTSALAVVATSLLVGKGEKGEFRQRVKMGVVDCLYKDSLMAAVVCMGVVTLVVFVVGALLCLIVK